MNEDIKDQIAEIRREIGELRTLADYLTRDVAFLEKMVKEIQTV